MISVIIITYNRKKLLEECLESILTQKTNQALEIIVVDNCSSDETSYFIGEKYKNKIKIIKNNARVGLWSCKNMTVNAAKGNIIAFTDDDCRVSENWIDEIKRSLSNRDFVGGPTYPMPDTVFPCWWQKSLEWLIGINTKPNKKYPPLGSNLAFHKYVLEEKQENKNINTKECAPYGEDNYRIKKALAENFHMQINPNLVVFHHINQERLTLSYLIKRSYIEGQALAVYDKKISKLLGSFLKLPYYLYRLIFCFDINGLFRIIATLSFVLNYMKNIILKIP